MRPDRFGRPRGLWKAGLQRVIALNALPVLESKISSTHLDVQRKENMLTTARDEPDQEAGLGWEGGVPAFGEGDLDCGVLMMHRAGLAHRLLTSAVSFSSAECSSHLATVQGNSHHHQLNTVWSNCTAFVHLPTVPFTGSSAPPSNM